MKVGTGFKLSLSLVAMIVLGNVISFAFNFNLWLGIGAAVITALIAVGLFKWVKKPLSEDGRFV